MFLNSWKYSFTNYLSHVITESLEVYGGKFWSKKCNRQEIRDNWGGFFGVFFFFLSMDMDTCLYACVLSIQPVRLSLIFIFQCFSFPTSCSVGALIPMIIAVGTGIRDSSSNLNGAICISFHTNSLKKSMNLSVPLLLLVNSRIDWVL